MKFTILDVALVTPEIGLIFWMTLTFLIVLFLLKKFAWTPIMQALKDREETIEGALSQAQKAKEEIANLKSQNEQLLKEARMERDKIISDANTASKQIIEKAQEEAKVQANKIVKDAKNSIEAEKKAALTEVKNLVAELSIDISEKILREKLSDDKSQEALVGKYLKDLNVN
ncbi:MAG: F0F1 ATP synthase subunit B [Cyclobacteriaceae bacterium]|nr:F0F1 ATP synthase subunit B [Cyclobacteriaceae bacterium]MCH8515008.1 F0F1 ATP synthase subunit B [Cyclobacteriaceae bacterium]